MGSAEETSGDACVANEAPSEGWMMYDKQCVKLPDSLPISFTSNRSSTFVAVMIELFVMTKKSRQASIEQHNDIELI